MCATKASGLCADQRRKKMKVTSISYSRVFSLPEYENEKIGITADIEEGDKTEDKMKELKVTVNSRHNSFMKERLDEEKRQDQIYRLEDMIRNLKAGINMDDDVPF